MSIETNVDSLCSEQAGSCNAIEFIIKPKEHELGGFSVRRLLPAVSKRKVGPWIFFDHMGPAEFAPGEGINVRPHPHINLATVTYLFEGEMLHRDSLGNELTINPGEINLMVAGQGIVHSERQREEVKVKGNKLNCLQLWLGLPEEFEEMPPAFFHYDIDEIPTVIVNDVSVRVLIGTAYGVISPVKQFAQTLYVEASMTSGQTLELPNGVQERGVYIVSGRVTAKETILDACTMTILHPGQNVVLEALEETQIAVIGGEPITHRHMWWNFVSSNKDRIEQAKQDWKNGDFAKVPGDDVEYIPLPEK